VTGYVRIRATRVVRDRRDDTKEALAGSDRNQAQVVLERFAAADDERHASIDGRRPIARRDRDVELGTGRLTHGQRSNHTQSDGRAASHDVDLSGTIVPRMSDQPTLQLDDAEGNRIHAVWSKSGKHLIVSVAANGDWTSASQVELTPEQVARLRDFLADGGQ
jgi:hypothetical protein